MTAQEERFEDLANEMQASHDIFAELNEWWRCRKVEEGAIAIYRQFDGDRDKLLQTISTHDQAEMEFQCQRKNEKEKALRQLWAMERQRMEAATTDDAAAVEEAAASTEAASSTVTAAKLDFRAKAMSSLMANTEFIPKAAASQQARQQEPPASNQTVPSTEPGPSSQQVQKTARSDEEIRRQFKTAVESRRRAQSNDNSTLSSNEASPSTQQRQTTALGQEVTPAESHRQVQPASKNPRTTNLFSAGEEEESRRDFLTFFPPIGEMRERAKTVPLRATTMQVRAHARGATIPRTVSEMTAFALARSELKGRNSKEKDARYLARMATYHRDRPANGGNPGNPGYSYVGGQDLEVQAPAAGQNEQGEAGNTPGGGDQQVGSDEQSSTNPSSQEPSSEEESSTPPSSRQSPTHLTHRENLKHRFHGTPNLIVSDSRRLINESPERMDPGLHAVLTGRLRQVIDEEGLGW